MNSKQSRLVRKGLVRPPSSYEFCSSDEDLFIPTPNDSIREQLPESDSPPKYDGMTIDDMRAATDFLFAGDDLQKVDAAKRLQNEHVFDLAKKYYKPKK